MKEFYRKANNFVKENIILSLLALLCVVFIVLKFPINIEKNFRVYESAGSNYAIARSSKMAAMPMSAVSDTVTNAKKIAQNFSINLLVDDVNIYQENIENSLKKYDGYIENFNSYKNDKSETITLNLKVPAKNVSDFIKELKGDSYVKSENYYTIDYTEKYSDNENRLKNLYTRRDRLRNMFNKETKTLADIIAVEKELNNVQLEIERLEKNNMKIDQEVEYSNVNVTLEPNLKRVNWSLKSAFLEALNVLAVAAITLLHYFLILVVFIPLLIAFFLLYIIFSKIYIFVKKKCTKQ